VQPMKRLGAFVVVALVVAGCSSDASSAPTTPSAAVTTSTSDTTVVATTSAPSSTATTTLVATTTLPPTTTTVATEDLIKKAVEDYSTGYHDCGLAPAACDPTSFTATQGGSRSTVTDVASGMVREGYYFSADQRGSYVVAESVSFPSSVEATAVYCVFDAGTVFGPIGPDGLPTVVNDQVLSLRNEYELFLEDGIWRVGDKRELERLGEGSLCPPAE
jgi:hypothetical protein